MGALLTIEMAVWSATLTMKLRMRQHTLNSQYRQGLILLLVQMEVSLSKDLIIRERSLMSLGHPV